MSKISKYIEERYSMLSENEARHPITQENVEAAVKVLRKYLVHNTEGLFYYLSAINLLNAAIKMKPYKKQLTYGFIKGKARAIVEYVIAKNEYEGVSYHYDAQANCLYIKVMDVVFSFHSVEETPFILGPASETAPIIWPGIRLQILSEDIFMEAGKLINDNIEKDNSLL